MVCFPKFVVCIPEAWATGSTAGDLEAGKFEPIRGQQNGHPSMVGTWGPQEDGELLCFVMCPGEYTCI